MNNLFHDQISRILILLYRPKDDKIHIQNIIVVMVARKDPIILKDSTTNNSKTVRRAHSLKFRQNGSDSGINSRAEEGIGDKTVVRFA